MELCLTLIFMDWIQNKHLLWIEGEYETKWKRRFGIIIESAIEFYLVEIEKTLFSNEEKKEKSKMVKFTKSNFCRGRRDRRNLHFKLQEVPKTNFKKS